MGRCSSIPEPVISPLRSYHKLMDPPINQWPVFPTFDHPIPATLVQEKLANRGHQSDVISKRRGEYAREFLLMIDKNIKPPFITTDGARSIL